MKEVFKSIDRGPKKLVVSNLGRVKRVHMGNGLTVLDLGCEMSIGYYCVNVLGKVEYVHRLVMEAFHGPSELQVNHKNGIKTDNRLENLEYVTPAENIQHALENGLKVALRGSQKTSAKLNEREVRQIKILYMMGGYSHRSLADIFGVCHKGIWSILKGKKWGHVKV
jgi:hypothetical protein